MAYRGGGLLRAMAVRRAEKTGMMAIAVNPRNTSRRCMKSGHTDKANRKKRAFRWQP